jgi:hypothetical protein
MIMKRIVDSSSSEGRGVRPFCPVSDVTTNGASPNRQAAKKWPAPLEDRPVA